MNYYERNIFPILNNLVTRKFEKERSLLLKKAKGRVLEIGFGSGLSLEFYEGIEHLTCIEPNIGMREKVDIQNLDFEVELIDGVLEKLPFKDHSFDYVVSSFVLCSVTELSDGIKEMKRVLKSDGKILFLEHVHSQEVKTKRIHRSFNPLWKKIGCGCSLLQETIEALEECGLQVEKSLVNEPGLLIPPVYMGIAKA